MEKEINNHTLEFIEDGHVYLVDGVIVPSITTLLKSKFGKKYEGISKDVLHRAAERGTEVHQAIQDFCEKGTESDLVEVKNFKFLQKHYKFKVIENEIPVILFKDDEPICAGRLDMVIEINDEIGGADIKRTSTLDKEYLAYQLNLYRIAYFQSYGKEWKFLKGIHLKDDIRKFVDIPINEEIAWELVNQYMEEHK